MPVHAGDLHKDFCRRRHGVGLDDPQRSLPTPTILWFCGSQWTPRWMWASSKPLWQRRPTALWPALGNVSPAGLRRWSFPSTLPWWDQIWSAVSISGFPCVRETWTYWSKSTEGPLRWLRDCNSCYVRRSCKSWDYLTLCVCYQCA